MERTGLSFAPFNMLSKDELEREERYWWHRREASTGMVAEIAERHRLRCLETLGILKPPA